jgi:hypothetical protein
LERHKSRAEKGIESAGERFGLTMLTRLRASRIARAALCVAALLSFGAALGLHPEPYEKGPPERDGTRVGSAPALATSSGHACLACRAQNNYSVSRLGIPRLLPPSSVVRRAAPRDASVGRISRPGHEGRAPPVLA